MSPGLAATLTALPAAATVLSFLVFVLLRRKRRAEADADAVEHGGKRLLGLYLRDYWYWLHRPLERAALRFGATPDALTLTGLAVTFAAGLAFAAGAFGLGGWLVVSGGALDILDGRIARAQGLTRPAGAFLDSTLDRYGDWALFAGLAVFFRFNWALWLALAALGGSSVVSYARARAESLGVACTDGWLQRGERFFVLAAAGILTPVLWWAGLSYALPMLVALALLAVLSNVTAVLRLRSVYTALDSRHRAAS